MAAFCNNGNSGTIRVRLLFDYPPPAVVDSRMCWLLVDLNACRVVADLESVIREKFEFSRGTILSLFVEDCYLPHTESIYVVRDNDSVRVKVQCLTQVNGHISSPDASRKNCRKRQRPTDKDDAGEDGVRVEYKKKKRGKREILEQGAEQASADERESQGKHSEEEEKKKKKKKKRKKKTEGNADMPKPAAPTKKIQTSVEHHVKSTKKPTATQATTQTVSSSDSSSTLKNKPLTSPSVKGRTKHSPKSLEVPSVLQSTNRSQKQAASTVMPREEKVMEPCNLDREDEIEPVNQPQKEQPGSEVSTQWSGRSSCRGNIRHDGPGERERGRGTGVNRGHSGSFKFSNSEAKEPSYQTDSLTNTSVVFQNGAESTPKQDYSSMPLLAAPPQVGQKIAFKLLELTENYTPEVSEYKEGKILSFDPTTKQIELELFHVSQAPAEPGKFDLVYQNPDGSERVEYAVSRGAWVTERWDSLLEPRLII
ncbi:LOW QUALITY PROTEIN: coilin [Anabas testudineus]|uniref:LOW QUALITY PROTEIN: coilin n=1 Tax=Anabas testudineus TaxID=64144 RepID=UPI000E455E83|nr:LOW QUALITY PROTEIN: coilin [Anabas testudineus]